MITFHQKNKKAARVSNCCRAGIRAAKGITATETKDHTTKALGLVQVTNYNICEKCGNACDGITFYEYLTEQLSYLLLGEKIPLDIVDGMSGELLIPAYRRITKTLLKKVAANYKNAECDPSPVRNKLREYIGNAAAKFGMEF